MAIQATVTTAVELTPAQRKKITTSLEKSHGEVVLREVVDPSVVGGVRLLVGSQEYDATVANRLEKARQQLLSEKKQA